jgi:hypothetical protein
MERYSTYVSPMRNELMVFGNIDGEQKLLFSVNGFEENINFTSMSKQERIEYVSSCFGDVIDDLLAGLVSE